MSVSKFSSRDWSLIAEIAERNAIYSFAQEAAKNAIETPIVSSNAALIAIDIIARANSASDEEHDRHKKVMSASSKVVHDVLGLKKPGEVYFITGVTN